MEFIGYRYFINTQTKEIHDVKNATGACGLSYIKHGKYVSKRTAKKLLSSGEYNGCAHCLPEFNTDK